MDEYRRMLFSQAKEPNASIEQLEAAADVFPRQVLKNPVLPLLALEDPPRAAIVTLRAQSYLALRLFHGKARLMPEARETFLRALRALLPVFYPRWEESAPQSLLVLDKERLLPQLLAGLKPVAKHAGSFFFHLANRAPGKQETFLRACVSATRPRAQLSDAAAWLANAIDARNVINENLVYWETGLDWWQEVSRPLAQARAELLRLPSPQQSTQHPRGDTCKKNKPQRPCPCP